MTARPDRRRVQASTAPRDTRQPGSPDWCYQTLNLMKRSYDSIHVDHQRFESYLSELRQHRAWEKVPVGRPYGTEEQMLMVELGKRIEQIAADVKKARATEVTLARAQAKAVGQGGHTLQANGLKLAAQGSNNKQKLLRRIARERPDVLDRYEKGEFNSARAAAKAAEIIKEPSAFELLLKLLVKLAPTLTAAEKRKLKELLG